MPETSGRTEVKRKREHLSTLPPDVGRPSERPNGKARADTKALGSSRKRHALSKDGARRSTRLHVQAADTKTAELDSPPQSRVRGHISSRLSGLGVRLAIADVSGTFRKRYGEKGAILDVLELYPAESKGCFFIVEADSKAKLNYRLSNHRAIVRSAVACFQRAHDKQGGASNRRQTNFQNPGTENYLRYACCNASLCSFGVVGNFVVVAVRTDPNQPTFINLAA